MTKTMTWLVCGGVLVAAAVPLGAQALSKQREAQNKLLAYRAARVDAIRKLAERIRGLNITAKTTVRDFVTESDVINTSLMAFLNGMREVDKPRYMPDGVCEVTLEITIADVSVALKQIYRAHYKGQNFKISDFDQMTVINKVKKLRETGSGAPREEFVEEDLIEPAEGQPAAGLDGASRRAQQFWAQHCTGRGRLMAERAARVEGMRKLAERIRGVFITGRTTVQDFVAESDEVNVSMQTFLKGLREVGKRYHEDELIVEVEMQVKLRTVYASLKSWAEGHYKGDKIKVKALEELILKAEDKILKETGMGVPPERYLKREAPVEVRQTVILAAQTPPWATQTLKATGNGAMDTEDPNKARAKLMAFRAAEIDARRKLAEQIQGLQITSNTSVRDFVAENDEIRTSLLAFQQGARVLDQTKKLNPDGTAEVAVEIELKPLWNSILYYQRKLSIRIR